MILSHNVYVRDAANPDIQGNTIVRNIMIPKEMVICRSDERKVVTVLYYIESNTRNLVRFYANHSRVGFFLPRLRIKKD